MNKSVVFIADFFVEQIVGGGELNNYELTHLLREGGISVTECQSHTVQLDFLKKNQDTFFIISNFMNLYLKATFTKES